MFQVCEKRGISTEALLTKQARIRLLARSEDWKAQAFQRGLEGESHAHGKDTPMTRPADLPIAGEGTEPSWEEPNGNAAGAGAADAERQRAAVDDFIATVAEKTGRKISRKNIWIVAGYEDSTEFERFQRADPRTTKSATKSFNRVLRMTPEHFIETLDKKSGPQ
jgi:hypothetical protein